MPAENSLARVNAREGPHRAAADGVPRTGPAELPRPGRGTIPCITVIIRCRPGPADRFMRTCAKADGRDREEMLTLRRHLRPDRRDRRAPPRVPGGPAAARADLRRPRGRGEGNHRPRAGGAVPLRASEEATRPAASAKAAGCSTPATTPTITSSTASSSAQRRRKSKASDLSVDVVRGIHRTPAGRKAGHGAGEGVRRRSRPS